MPLTATSFDAPSASTRRPSSLDWSNIVFLWTAHAMAVLAIVWLAAVRFSWLTVGLGGLWFALCGFAITGGYHRLFAHPCYRANPLLRAVLLFFGAGAFQNSALKWSSDHRSHHSKTDTDRDPYNIRRGFWWAHILWIFYEDDEEVKGVKDLAADPLIRFQHRHYVWLGIVSGMLLPGALGFLWGDPIGALLVAGFLRLAVQWHATFAVNSVAHTLGSQPYCSKGSARDSWVTALVTLGEGYHNFHHRFQLDYRNGVRWFHLDPTKWAIWSLSKVGLTRELRRTPASAIRRAREAVLAGEG